MPALITHQLIAEKTLEYLPNELIKDKSHYYFGAQGGDPFYFYRYTKWKKSVNFGTALHRHDIYQTFENFRKNLQNSRSFAAFSYVLGYITHYCTDIIFHPFVYYLVEKHTDLTDKTRAKDKLHFLIESDIDVYLLQKTYGDNFKQYELPVTFNDLNIPALYELYEEVYLNLCSDNLIYNDFRKAIKRFFFLNGILQDNNYKKQRFITGIENLFGLSHILSYFFRREQPDDDYLNIENKIWHNLTAPENSKQHSAYELFLSAAELSGKYILSFTAALAKNAPLKFSEFSTDLNIGLI